MKEEIVYWLKNIEKHHGVAPVEVIAFNFGLFESGEGFMMYLVGAFEYSEEDDDWACVQVPKKEYWYLRFPDEFQSKSWEEILALSERTLSELEKEGVLNSTLLKNAKAITTGFDDGILMKILGKKTLISNKHLCAIAGCL